MVIIILGSKSDLDLGNEIKKHVDAFGVDCKIRIASAHKTPEYLLNILKEYGKQTNLVYICVAGQSNALGGFVDSAVVHPVINCPPYSEKYAGFDVLSSLRMPSGVSPMTVLKPEQAALAAAKILANSDSKISEKIKSYQKTLKDKILKDDEQIT